MLKIDVKQAGLKFGNRRWLVRIIGQSGNGHKYFTDIGEVEETNTKYYNPITFIEPKHSLGAVYKKDKAVKMLVSEFEKKVGV